MANKNSKFYILVIAAIAIIVAALGTLIYYYRNSPNVKTGEWGGPAEFGQFGDMIGGIINPIFGALTTILLLITYNITRHESLRESRKNEREEIKKMIDEFTQALTNQQREANFKSPRSSKNFSFLDMTKKNEKGSKDPKDLLVSFIDLEFHLTQVKTRGLEYSPPNNRNVQMLHEMRATIFSICNLYFALISSTETDLINKFHVLKLEQFLKQQLSLRLISEDEYHYHLNSISTKPGRPPTRFSQTLQQKFKTFLVRNTILESVSTTATPIQPPENDNYLNNISPTIGNIDEINRERRTPTYAIGIFVTLIWLAGVVILIYVKRESLTGLRLNELGDFFAGICAPIAFLWLVLGYFLQGEELKQNTKALLFQYKELKDQVSNTKLLATHSGNQATAAIEATRNQVMQSWYANYLHLLRHGPIFQFDNPYWHNEEVVIPIRLEKLTISNVAFTISGGVIPETTQTEWAIGETFLFCFTPDTNVTPRTFSIDYSTPFGLSGRNRYTFFDSDHSIKHIETLLTKPSKPE